MGVRPPTRTASQRRPRRTATASKRKRGAAPHLHAAGGVHQHHVLAIALRLAHRLVRHLAAWGYEGCMGA